MGNAPKQSLGLEAIAHQKDRAVYNMLSSLFNSVIRSEVSADEIEPTVKDLLKGLEINLEVKFHPNVAVPAAMVEYYDVNGAHALTHDMKKAFGLTGKNETADKLWDRAKSHLATIDRKNVKLGGFFSKLPFVIHLAGGLFEHMDGEEIAAVFLHELGHAWSYCEILTFNIYANQVLEAASDAWKSRNPNEKLTLIRAVGLHGANIESVETMSEEDYLKAVNVLSSKRIMAMLQERDSQWYDRSSNEALADQFATRMGAGRALVSGLEKLEKFGGSAFYRSNVLSLTASIIKITAVVAWTTVTLGFGLVQILLAAWLSDSPTSSYGYGTYDNDKDRYKRILHQCIDALKDRRLDPETRRRTLKDIEYIRKSIDEMSESIQIFRGIHWLFSPSYRRQLRTKKDQQLLEELANNSLYESAARLTV